MHTGQVMTITNQVFDDLIIENLTIFLIVRMQTKQQLKPLVRLSLQLIRCFVVNPGALLVLGDTNSCLSVIPQNDKRFSFPHGGR